VLLGTPRPSQVRDHADLARFGGVTRARISQIMDLLNLLPAIQEEILFLPRTAGGRDPVTEQQIRPIVTIPGWREQRVLWRNLRGGSQG